MIVRDVYLNKIIQLKDTYELVKVITGVRRSGKSTLLLLFHKYLLEQGVPESSIIFINFEDFGYRELYNPANLHDYISKRLALNGKTYILLDEIQIVDEWEKVVNSLRINKNNDIFITGSNASLLSGKLATLLSGRYIELRIYPLSFREYLTFNCLEAKDKSDSFSDYMISGGLPALAALPDQNNIKSNYLSDVVNTIIVKDIASHWQVRDIDLLNKLIGFLSSNIGKLTNASNLAGFLTSIGTKTSSETVDNYLRLLEEGFIFLKALRYNLYGKYFMKTNSKYYIVDLGLRNAIIGSSGYDYGSSLENIIFLELLRRGYTVYTGQFKDWEVDFVAKRKNEQLYIQVTASVADENTLNRELRSLKAITDNHPKYILTMDKLPYDDFDGIKGINIIDFLLETHPIN
ncbi:MAG: ATP-binding protein [Sphaerochaetaceae bacterium]